MGAVVSKIDESYGAAGECTSPMDLATPTLRSWTDRSGEFRDLACDFVRDPENCFLPSDFFCPITHDLMHDPVYTRAGSVYERAAITRWLKSNDTNPEDNMRLEDKKLTPCLPTKRRLEAFRSAVCSLGTEAAALLTVPQQDCFERSAAALPELFEAALRDALHPPHYGFSQASVDSAPPLPDDDVISSIRLLFRDPSLP